MTDDLLFERLLTRALADAGPDRAPERVLVASLEAVRTVPQRRPRIAALDGATWPAAGGSLAHPRTAAVLRSLAMALLLLALLASTLVGVAVLSRVPRADLVFGSASGGLWVARSDGGDSHRIANDGWYVEPRLSPDGRWIAARLLSRGGPFPPAIDGSGPERLVILDAEGALVMELGSANPATYTWGAVGSSAGLLAAALDDQLVVVDPATRTSTVVDEGEPSGRTFAWSPVGPTLYWTVGRSMNFRPIIGAEVRSANVERASSGPRLLGVGGFDLVLDRARSLRGLEAMAVSPDGRRLAFRARMEGWLRSQLVVATIGDAVPVYLTPPPPAEPSVSTTSGVQWTPAGDAVVTELLRQNGDEVLASIGVIPIDGSGAVRSIDLHSAGIIVGNDGPDPTGNGSILAGAFDPDDVRYPSMAQRSIAVHDLWLVEPDSGRSRLVQRDTLGGDLQ